MNKVKSVDALLQLIKSQGPQTSGTLAKKLGLTSMGARQHLLRLEEKQIVSSFHEKAQVGRPKLLWQLTEKGHARFPDRHADLTLHLIDSIKVIYGEEGLDKLISAREAQMSNHYIAAISGCKSLDEKVAMLAQLRSAEGYMAATEQLNENEYLLIESHCPICSAAKTCQNFCRSELNLFNQCFGEEASVERTEHIVSGDRRCSYRIMRN